MKIEPIKPVDKKFKDLVHYICSRGAAHMRFSSTILNKVLWFADSSAYIHHGKSVSGSKYIRRDFGPVPERILDARSELVFEGKIAFSKEEYFNCTKDSYMSLQEPNLSALTKEEIDFVSRWLDYICENHDATSISALSHDVIWKAAKNGEEIPLCALLASRDAVITPKHMEWADNALSSMSKAA